MGNERKRWTPQEEEKLREVWHKNVKMDALADLFPGRTGGGLFYHGSRQLKLGKRVRTHDYSVVPTWLAIVAHLKKRPMTSVELAAATGMRARYVYELIKQRRGADGGEKLVYVADWTTQCQRGGPSRLWGLGDKPDKKKPAPMARRDITKRYKKRLEREEPEKLDKWRKSYKTRLKEKAGKLAKRDIAASWF